VKTAVVSRVHYGGAALLQIRPNANVIQMVMEVGFGVERSKYPIRDAMIHHRATERVSEAIRCVIWDASELLDDGAEVICKLISLGVRHEMKDVLQHLASDSRHDDNGVVVFVLEGIDQERRWGRCVALHHLQRVRFILLSALAFLEIESKWKSLH
jgi:hypothetical protein